MGGSVTDYGGLYRYLDVIEESPRLRISTFGETFEHRELILLTISSPDNLARLEDIQRDTRRLADPRGLAGDEAEAVIARTPAGVFLNYGNDGNESAAFEAALWMAWELLSGRHDELLGELVVYIVPASNPDSHERFAAWFKATARWPDGDPDPNAVEHRAPWGLSTNNNHYQINLNRDSVWSTQPENRALVRLYLDTRPMVFVDHHGETDSFIGPWMAEPLHTVLTANQRDWLVEYGRAMAADFASEGFPYAPWEFGQFDPGYWDTLPNFTGSIGFTLETTGGGWRGLRLARAGGGEYTLRDGIEQHLIAGRSVLALTAAHRERRLRDYLAYRREALDEGERPGGWLLSGASDPARLDAARGVLLRNGIEVRRTSSEVTVRAARPMFPRGGPASEITLPPGSLVVPGAQPEGRLLQVLLEQDARFSEEFLDYVDEHRERRSDPSFGHPDIWTSADAFYDITGWSVPLTYRLDAWTVGAADLPPPAASEAVSLEDPVADPPPTRGEFRNQDAEYAFLVAGDSDHAIRAAAWLREEGVPFRVATAAFETGGESFGRGALLVFAGEAPDLPALRAGLAGLASAGARVLGVDGPLTASGPHLGSDQFVQVARGRVAMVMGGPVRPSAYGSPWYLFERRFGLRFTALSWDRLATTDLRGYRVLILPDGGYPDPGGDPRARLVLDHLEEWTDRGGVLIAMRGASAWLAGEDVSWTRTRLKPGFASKSAFMTDGGRPDDPSPDAEESRAARRGDPRRHPPRPSQPGELPELRLRGAVPGDGLVEPRLRTGSVRRRRGPFSRRSGRTPRQRLRLPRLARPHRRDPLPGHRAGRFRPRRPLPRRPQLPPLLGRPHPPLHERRPLRPELLTRTAHRPWTAGLQTGTHVAPRHARRNSTHLHGASPGPPAFRPAPPARGGRNRVPLPARITHRLGTPISRSARAALCAAHGAAPLAQGGAYGLERRLQPARQSRIPGSVAP